MKPRWWIGIAVLGVVLAGAFVIVYMKARDAQMPRALKLEDGTEFFFRGDTRIEPAANYTQNREVAVDGDAFIRLPTGADPWILKTRLLVLKADGGTELRITAYWKETGEQMEVLRGHVIARKSYPSTQAEPEDLRDGDMILINRTIDLMEKERTDRAQLEAWSQDFIQQAQAAERELPADP